MPALYGTTEYLQLRDLIEEVRAAASLEPDVSGDLTVTGGDIIIATAGRGLKIKEGSNARMGRVQLAGATTTVATTAVSAASEIFLTCQIPGGTPGFLRVSARVASTSFTITSSAGGSDTSTVGWMIVEPSA